MWKAQYEQFGQWHDMNFESINVNTQPGGLIQASGQDTVGKFTFNGSFSPEQPECRIHKKYNGQHDIYYFGTFNQQTGEIHGKWGFKPGDSDGGFRMKKTS